MQAQTSGDGASVDLSIVIVNWNTLQMTKECLESVFAGLDGPDAGRIVAEVILVDNASADGSADMVERDFPRVILIRNTENRGFAAANNQGFAIAKGRRILLLNSDTLVHGDVLSASVDYVDSHPKVGAFGCKVLNPDGTVQLTCHQYPWLLNELLMTTGLWKLKWPRFFGRYMMTHWQRDDERPVQVISGCYLLIRREILEQVGPLDEDFFFFGEETDWCRCIADAGWTLMFAPVGTITHYGSASARKLNHRRDVLLTAAKIRLHRKHDGWFAAAAAWLMAFGFNGSRALFWTLRAALGGGEAAKARAVHFHRVMGDIGEWWRGGTHA